MKITDFASTMGPGHMGTELFLVAVRCYFMRKRLMADYAGKRFVPEGDEAGGVVNAGMETSRPPPPPAAGFGSVLFGTTVTALWAKKKN